MQNQRECCGVGGVTIHTCTPTHYIYSKFAVNASFVHAISNLYNLVFRHFHFICVPDLKLCDKIYRTESKREMIINHLSEFDPHIFNFLVARTCQTSCPCVSTL